MNKKAIEELSRFLICEGVMTEDHELLVERADSERHPARIRVRDLDRPVGTYDLPDDTFQKLFANGTLVRLEWDGQQWELP